MYIRKMKNMKKILIETNIIMNLKENKIQAKKKKKIYFIIIKKIQI